MNIVLPTLYSRTATGAIQTWTAEVDGGRWRTTYGQTDGMMTTTEWYNSVSTNVGRANERNEISQALFEANASWKKHLETGYHANIKNIDKATMIDCMLAHKFEDRVAKLEWPLYTQPKLDGIRCLCTKDAMFSRGGKIFKSAPHILKTLGDFFEKHPDVVLDGELYCDKLANDFNKITSLVKKTKPNAKDLEESEKVIQYHVYDLIDTTSTFSHRNQWLETNLFTAGLNNSHVIKHVMTVKVDNIEQLNTLYEGFLAASYEGQMVRVDDIYETKRSKFLLKRKEFQDKEYQILEVGEGTGNRTGMAGFMVMKNDDGTIFKSNIKGSHEFLTELLQNKQEIVGQLATVQFFHLTPDGVPRFPYVVAIRNYE